MISIANISELQDELTFRWHVEAMEAWRTSCPRMTVWEDAVSDGLVRVERGGSMKEARVVLTPRGQAALDFRTSCRRSAGAASIAQRIPNRYQRDRLILRR